TLLTPITPASDTVFPFSQRIASRAEPQLPLIHTDICLGLSSHPGLDVSACVTHTSEEANGCVHVLSNLFLHREYQEKVIGPWLISWP
uniref:FAS1 domain-containing protein n=1 Tax=Mesocestoides corti TaxID=53468 RepID=A0A5K3EFN6_MESCO